MAQEKRNPHPTNGKITGPKGHDKVPLQGTAGEYVLPVKTVQTIGTHALDQLVRETNGKEPGPKMVAGTAHAASGGALGKSVTDTVKDWFGFGAQPATAQPGTTPAYPASQPIVQSPPTPTPELLGAGAAAGAGQAFINHRQQLDAVAGYADGGVVSPLTQEEADRQAILQAGGAAAAGGKKLAAAAADIFTLPVRGVMGAANTALRVPNAFGANIPYIPEAAFGGSSSSLTPYFDRVRDTAGATPTSAPVAPAPRSIMTPQAPTAPRLGALPPAEAPAAPAPTEPAAPEAQKPPLPTFGGLAGFYGASMRIKQAAAADEMRRTTELKLPEMERQRSETNLLNTKMQAIAAEKDPAKRQALLFGQSTPASELETPIGIQGPYDPKNPTVNVFNKRTGQTVNMPIQQAPAALREGERGTMKNAQGQTVPVIVRNGVRVPL